MPSTAEMRELYRASLRIFDAIRQCPTPVIAAAGADNELVVACDLAIAGRSSTFGQTGPRVGSVPATGATNVTSLQIGKKKARELTILCRRYSADQALAMGLARPTTRRTHDRGGIWATGDTELPRSCGEAARTGQIPDSGVPLARESPLATGDTRSRAGPAAPRLPRPAPNDMDARSAVVPATGDRAPMSFGRSEGSAPAGAVGLVGLPAGGCASGRRGGRLPERRPRSGGRRRPRPGRARPWAGRARPWAGRTWHRRRRGSHLSLRTLPLRTLPLRWGVR
jgi:hypothetical protein